MVPFWVLNMIAEVVLNFYGTGEPVTSEDVPNDLGLNGQVISGGIQSLVACEGISSQNDGPKSSEDDDQAVFTDKCAETAHSHDTRMSEVHS